MTPFFMWRNVSSGRLEAAAAGERFFTTSHSAACQSGRLRQSTEAVDNSVDNMGARRLIAYVMGPEVKLMIFSPA